MAGTTASFPTMEGVDGYLIHHACSWAISKQAGGLVSSLVRLTSISLSTTAIKRPTASAKLPCLIHGIAVFVNGQARLAPPGKARLFAQ